MSSPVFVSRLPVGSSARITRGSFDERAGDRHALLLATGELLRADATRVRRARPRRAAASDRLRGPRRRASRAGRAPLRRCRRAVSVGIRLNCWKTKPKVRAASSASSPVGRASRGRVPRRARVPSLGRSSAPSSWSSVVFPDPLGPSSATKSPAPIVDVDASRPPGRRRCRAGRTATPPRTS